MVLEQLNLHLQIVTFNFKQLSLMLVNNSCIDSRIKYEQLQKEGVINCECTINANQSPKTNSQLQTWMTKLKHSKILANNIKYLRWIGGAH